MTPTPPPSGPPEVSFVVRRRGGHPVEFAPAAGIHPRSPAPDATPFRVSAYADGDLQVYEVLAPDGYVLRPGDWRDAAYDHARVAGLLARCVEDNLRPFVFEPATAELERRAEARLTLALADLASAFDLLSVTCVAGDGRLLATLEGEHKNGERRSYVVPIALG